jgi:transposase
MRLTKETRAEIEQLRRQTRDKKQHIRLSVLIMLDEGFTHEVIAVSLGIDSDTVGNYKQKYLQKGLQEYLKDNYVAYQGALTKEQLQQLHQKVQEGLYQRAREVGDYIFGEFKVDYSDSAVRAILAKLDFVHKPVKPLPAQANEQKQLEFVAQFKEVIAHLPQDTVVYFTDATHPTHNSQKSRAWIKKGQDKHIPANSGRKRVNINGALNALDPCEALVIEAQTINAQNTITLYEKLLASNPGKKLVLICDNAPYYRSRLLQKWLEGQPLIKQWFLPTYSPNLNLIERLWRFMKKKAIGLSFHPTYKAFKSGILHFFEHLDDYEYELKSLLTLKFQILHSPLANST